MQKGHFTKSTNKIPQTEKRNKKTSMESSSHHLTLGQQAKNQGVTKAEAKRIMKYQKASHLAQMKSQEAQKLKIPKLVKPDTLTVDQTQSKQQNMSAWTKGVSPLLRMINQKNRTTKSTKNDQQYDQVVRPDKRNLPINSGPLFINKINYIPPSEAKIDLDLEPSFSFTNLKTRVSSHIQGHNSSQNYPKSTFHSTVSGHKSMNAESLKYQILYLMKLRLKMQQNIFLLFRRIEKEMNQQLAGPAFTLVTLGKLVSMQTEKVARISLYLKQVVLQLKDLDAQ